MFTETKEFRKANKERKIELIKIDAYNLLLNYLLGNLNLTNFLISIDKLSNFKVCDEKNFKIFIVKSIKYETYQSSIGKSNSEKQSIKQRMFNFLAHYNLE